MVLQIQGHPARGRAGGAVQREELPSALQFLLLPTLIQTIRREAAVEVAVDVATVDGTSFGITDFKSQGKASGFQQIGLLTPLVDQPGPIDFIAVGATNHQHIAAGHHDASTST